MYRYYLHDKKLPSGGSTKEKPIMTATTEAAKLRNLESSLLFLQQEHADTLKCLHEEIRTLQKKNKDLTFRLEMGRDVSTSSDAEDRIRSLTSQLEALHTEHENTNSEKERKIQSLEKHIKLQEKSFRDELKTYSSKFRKCQQELQSKGETIAELQHKLYSVNKDLAMRRSSDTPLVPTPPKEGAPTRVRRNSRKVVPIEVQTLERPLSSSSGNLRRDYVIDPSPFLIREGSLEQELRVQQKRQHDPLPPIAASIDQSQSPVPVRRPEAEVVQLAVGSVQKNEPWRQAPSHSSHYK